MGRDDNGAVVKSGHVRNLLVDGVRKRKVQEGAGVGEVKLYEAEGIGCGSTLLLH